MANAHRGGNALRHGLTAETVIEGLEDTEDYRAFEAAIISDYDAQTAVERELVLRLASLLWRMRRAISIETDLLRIQAEILRDRRNDFGPADHDPGDGLDRVAGGRLGKTFDEGERSDAQHDRCEHLDDWHDSTPMTSRALTYCFLRPGNREETAVGERAAVPRALTY
jgi:hypothetical protein